MPSKSNLLSDFKHYLLGKMRAIYNENEAKSIAKLLLTNGIKITALQYSDPTFRLSEGQMVQLYRWINRLEANEPIQYILGETYFYNGTVSVEPGVLIPRSETEEIIHYLAKTLPENAAILDLCTGSGCIPVALTRENKNFKITAIELSDLAIKIAEKNFNSVQPKPKLLKADVLALEPNFFTEKFDCIVSNPPYVTQADKLKMEKNVLDFEPHMALFVPENNPLIFFEKISLLAKDILKPNGIIMVEINEALGSETANIFLKDGYKAVEIRKDLNQKDRFIVARISD
jgi:release factor glutamine methyltransferase